MNKSIAERMKETLLSERRISDYDKHRARQQETMREIVTRLTFRSWHRTG